MRYDNTEIKRYNGIQNGEKESDMKEEKKQHHLVEAGKATRFQPGNQLAKGRGRPAMTEDQKALALTSRTELKNVMVKYMSLSPEEVEELLEENKLPVIDIAILRNLKKMHEDGSMDRADWILDHIMGSRAKKVEVKNTSPINLKNLSKQQLKNLKDIIESQGIE